MKAIDIKLKGGDGTRIKTVEEVPTKTSELTNDSNFINESVFTEQNQWTLQQINELRNCETIVKINVFVTQTLWVADTTYSGYPYKASLEILGVCG